MRLPATAYSRSVCDATRESVQRGKDFSIERTELTLYGPFKAYSTRYAVETYRRRTDDLGQSPTCYADQPFKLERSVLALAKAKTVPGVLIAFRIDVRDAVVVPANEHRRAETFDLQRTVRSWQSASEQKAE